MNESLEMLVTIVDKRLHVGFLHWARQVVIPASILDVCMFLIAVFRWFQHQ